jgi:hypothetical protein
MYELGALLCFVIVVCNAVLLDRLFCCKCAAWAWMYFSRFCNVEVLVALYLYMFNHIEYSTVSWYRCLRCVSWHSYLCIPTRVLVFRSSVAQTANGEFLVCSANPRFFRLLGLFSRDPEVSVWTGSSWFRIGTGGVHL